MITGFNPLGLASSPGGPWIALLVWAILAGTAYVDARSGRVPNKPLVAGALFVSVCYLFIGPPELLLEQIAWALLCGFVIWAINAIWYSLRKHDALGMGDAKWSMLAALGFGVEPVFWAWVVAAWLALGWIAITRLRRLSIKRVFFAPFLLAGLALVKMLLAS